MKSRVKKFLTEMQEIFHVPSCGTFCPSQLSSLKLIMECCA